MLRIHRYRFPNGQRGTALIEFALVLPLLLALTLLVVDFGRAFYCRNVLEQAAREGVRSLSRDSSTVVARTVATSVAKASGCDITTIGVTIPPDTTYSTDYVQVRVEVRGTFRWIYRGLLGFLGAPSSDPIIKSTCAMKREY